MTWLTIAQAREFLSQGEGEGIKIAVLDSGVETAHPALAGLALADDLLIMEENQQLVTAEANGNDIFGHGTAIAGIIHAIAPKAKIGSFRVLGPQLRSRTAIICEGARQAIRRGYQILNCSFGCGRPDHVLHYKDWIDAAYIHGRHLVAAANNLDLTKREWPGHFPSVITVTFTGDAPPLSLFYRPGTLVEFAAPGQDLEVPWSGGARKKVTGSSFAAPHAAGLLARLLSCAPDLPPLEAKALLQQIATPAAGNLER